MIVERNWLGRDLAIAAWVVAITPFAALTMLGGDGPLLGTITACLCAWAAVAVFAMARPSGGFYPRIWLPLLLVAMGLGWAIYPDLARVAGSGGAVAARIAPDLVWPELARALGATALMIAAAALGYRRGLLRIAIDALCVAAAINLAIGLTLRQIDPLHVWGFDKGMLVYRFTGTMLNANAMGTVYAAIAVIALGGALSVASGAGVAVNRQRMMIFYLLLYGAMVGGAGLTGSRAAFVGALGGSALLVLVYALRRRGIRWSGPALWAALLFLFAILMTGGVAAFQRLGNLPADAIKRGELWGQYAMLAMEAGPFGHGLGSFAQVNAAYLPPTALATQLWYVNAAHNVVLQMIIEGGWAYMLLIAIAMALIGWRMVRHLPQVDRGGVLPLAIAIGLLVILTGAMVDIALNIPGVAALAAVLLGLSWGHALRRDEGQRGLTDMSRAAING